MSVEGGSLLASIVELMTLKNRNDDLFINGVSRVVFGRSNGTWSQLIKGLNARRIVDIVNNVDNLHLFAKKYLCGAQLLTSPRAVSNYLKVCITFSINEIAGEILHSDPIKWVIPLVQHIYHANSFNHLQSESDNSLLTSLHAYMGYTQNGLLPRIKECFENLHNTPYGTEVHGYVLLSSFATEYFGELYKFQSDANSERVKSEATTFLNSKAIEIFAALYMKLHLIHIGENINPLNQRSLQDMRTIFINLLGACWSISQGNKRDVWMANLFKTLRQIQLTVMLSTVRETTSLKQVAYKDIKNSSIVENKVEFLMNQGPSTDKDQVDASCALDIQGFAGEIGATVYNACGETIHNLQESYDYLKTKAYKLFRDQCKGTPPEPSGHKHVIYNKEIKQEVDENTLPINVKYIGQTETDDETAYVTIPLSKVGNKRFNYRTVLKRNDEEVVELAINSVKKEHPVLCFKVPTKF
ncbi:conserved hypothetical protein [Theileria equi strain WA]|uniref:Uncharacterized protein n=1 Tax=Theileria equi strain WA TaxID=1537102 RepID=L1LG46_THEEQ|nr:conserved hypothetical protein [Theileria equi strain WA]EKX74412.1 conserved hypothetical protein [Theileria equi strain WA]|eukprot:XP_004833864.1 conserved hypothetical protein [Theileria equi strain WA]